MSYIHRHKRTLKRLKRRFGVKIILVDVVVGEVDLNTGTRSSTETETVIKKCPVMPATKKSNFVYDIAFLAANKNFTEGGYFDEINVEVIIDADDLPEGYTFSKLNYVKINGVKYEYVTHQDFMVGLGYIMKLKGTN